MRAIRTIGFGILVSAAPLFLTASASADQSIKDITIEVVEADGKGVPDVKVSVSNFLPEDVGHARHSLPEALRFIYEVADGRTDEDGKATFSMPRNLTNFTAGVYTITVSMVNEDGSIEPTSYWRGYEYIGPGSSATISLKVTDFRGYSLFPGEHVRDQLQSAIDAGNRERYDTVMERVDESLLEDELEIKDQRQAIEELREANDIPRYGNAEEVGRAIKQAEALKGAPGSKERLDNLHIYQDELERVEGQEFRLQQKRDASDELPKFPKESQSSMTPAGPGEFFASAGLDGYAVDQPNYQYVRFSDFNIQQVILDPVLDFDNDDVGVQGGGEVGYVFTNPFFGVKDWVAIQVSYADVENSASTNQIQGIDADAEFFGPAGGGFTILGLPDVFLDNVVYSNDYSHIGVNLRAYSDIPSGIVTLTPFVGIDFSHIDLDTSLALTAVGAPTVNVTRSDAINSDEFGLSAGIYASHLLDTNLTLYGGGHGTITYSDADGSSTLTQDSGGGTPVESASISGSQATIKLGLGVGLRYDFTDRISGSLEGGYDFSNAAPVVQYSTQANQPADIDFDTINSFTFGAKLTVGFSP